MMQNIDGISRKPNVKLDLDFFQGSYKSEPNVCCLVTRGHFH